MRLFDLTRPIRPGMPVYPGDPPVEFAGHASCAGDGYCVTRLSLGTHSGTHLDAPAHFLPGEPAVESLPLEALVGPARVIDLGKPLGDVRAGERLLLRSGWSARWGEPGYFDEFPALPAEALQAVLGAPAALVGLESPSLCPDHEEDARMHRALLGAGVVIVENLVGLERLPDRVFLAALPLPLAGLDGSPCRVVAWPMPATEEAVEECP